MGLDDPHKVLTMDDMVGDGDVIFAATGVTPGEFLGGVRYLAGRGAPRRIRSSCAAKTRTIRFIRSLHMLEQAAAPMNGRPASR